MEGLWRITFIFMSLKLLSQGILKITVDNLIFSTHGYAQYILTHNTFSSTAEIRYHKVLFIYFFLSLSFVVPGSLFCKGSVVTSSFNCGKYIQVPSFFYVLQLMFIQFQIYKNNKA